MLLQDIWLKHKREIMEYIKIHIDEMFQKMIFFEYRLIEEDKSNDMVNRAFPFAKLVEKEPHIEELVKGTIIGIYYEQRGSNITTERQWIDKSEPLDQDTIDYIVSLAKRVCVNMVYDEILKPPTIDEQVEDFIKEFFEEGDSEPLEQKDFLAEFFEELSDDKQDVKDTNTISSQIKNKFDNTTLKQKDFLSEFFEQLDDE
jgi:polyhydroxyalkanoate synthesis regulator phasin|tara:strand:+ start:4050 stop:4652 length:603 start_codon:yes stop_codon:yes gene_type:complete